MEGVAVLRQLVGQIQELWELYGSFCPDHPHLNPSSVEDDYCGLIMGEKSEYLKMLETNKSPPCKRSRREKNREKSLVSSSTAMEQQIWKEFPEDLYEGVIARLPIATFFRFRSVCRKWNSLLTSNSFSQHFAEVPRVHPWFYTITHEDVNSGAMYDPSMRKWHHPSIPFLPAKMIILPVASAGGLVCFLDIGHRNFYICNPLTDSFRELPPRSVRVWSRVAVGMILNGNTASSGYKIVWLGCNGDHEIYDSVQNSWTRPGIVPPSIKLPLSLNFRSQTVSIGTTLYFMRAEPDGILSYDVATGVWKQFIIPSPLHLTDHTLAEHKGQVMLVGLLSKNAATCVCIWELQKMTLLWKEVDRMPNIWCLEFYGKHVRMTCLGNRGLLMLSLRSRRMNRLITYDMSDKQWQKVPDCMLPRGRKRQWIACGTAFHPCPTALA
ncbi:F-box only protein 6-like isoform X2 [Phoenix dactylifera]|uniref:F-box only protein 6-like isoform X2 n=1 Tax=Phoenix dactylifera TaxID=42345 RepID=A0A8B7CLQ6_PHODC|nr:F-box only protein 6-like isoform X2 [Phoenix dactylifera]